MLVEGLRHRKRAIIVHLIDISADALELSERTLGGFDYVSILGHRATYEEGLRHAAHERPAKGTLVTLFLGSNIGNFDPPAAHEFLTDIRGCLRPGDALVLGADLIKPERDLLLAYDDPLGVTAAFNRNLLARMNTELLADFDLSAFAHRAVWNPGDRRVEMHLVSKRDQTVRISRADVVVGFREGEWIWTESSYKYSAEEVVAMGVAAGFKLRQQWIEPDARFALTLFVAD